MAATHTHRRSVLSGSGSIVSVTNVVSSDGELIFDGIVAGSTLYAANEIDLGFTVADLKSLVISTDKAIGLKTNASDGGADQTLSLLANDPIIWKVTDQATCPITATVTKFYANNGSAGDAHLKIHALVDTTP